MTVTVLLASSGGGHAIQARLLQTAFQGQIVEHIVAGGRDSRLWDCSISTLWRVPVCFFQAVNLVRRLRPQTIVSTGALPGLIALGAGRLIGARAIWIDSVANARKLSLSGKAARFLAHRTYTQWPEIATRERVRYAGAVI